MKSYLRVLAFFAIGAAVFAQAPPKPEAPKADKAVAYYHYAMGHLYAELASNYGSRSEYVNKAIDHYRQAIKADPTATFPAEELSELYIQAGRLREAVIDAEEALRQNPDDLNARRLLGRIYTRSIGDPQQNKINEEMLKKAIEQYQAITTKAPTDVTALVLLGRLQKVAQNSVEAEKAYKKALEVDPTNEDALAGLAMVYVDVGDTKRATELLAKANEKSPSLRNLVTLAQAYEQMRDYKQAASTLQRALEMSPGNTEVKRDLAQNLMLSDKLDEARKLYEELSEDDPKDASLQLRISQIYRQQRDFAKAHAAQKKAREIDPNSIEIRYNEVNLLESEGKTQEAVDALKGILSSTQKRSYHPGEKANRALLLERLGYLQRSTEQFPQAIESFREMAEVDSDQGPRSRVHIIETYRASKEFPRAWDEAEAALKQFPSDRSVRTAHAYVAADMGKTDIAVRELKDLFDGKNDRETHLAIAQMYEKAKNYVEMAKALDAAEKLSDSKEEREGVIFMRGAMYEKQKKYDLAEAEFRKVLETNPESASALNYLGYMLADRNVRLQEAQQLIAKALELDPNNGAYLDSLGWVYYRLGKFEEAEKQLLLAIEKTGRDPTVHDHLGDVYMRRGKLREAIQQWQKSLKEWESTAATDQDPVEVAKIQKKLENAKTRLAKENGSKPKN
jgi:tetratricopeptide (TPR) repeat protein